MYAARPRSAITAVTIVNRPMFIRSVPQYGPASLASSFLGTNLLLALSSAADSFHASDGFPSSRLCCPLFEAQQPECIGNHNKSTHLVKHDGYTNASQSQQCARHQQRDDSQADD